MTSSSLSRFVHAAALLVVLALAACGGGGGGSDGGTPPPADPGATGGPGVDLDGVAKPDVLLMTFSGHTNSAFPLSPAANETYLDVPGSAGPKLRAFFEGRGLAVVERHFADRLRAPDADGNGRPDRLDQLGFVEALSVLRQAAESWMDGQIVPTRVVVVGHSHGATWAHLLCEAADGRVAPGALDIHVLVTLDGVQTGWDGEHQGELMAWWDALPGKTFQGFHLPRDVSMSADAVAADAGNRNVKDVVWPVVRFAYEIMSDDPLGVVLRDLVRNVPLFQVDLVPGTDPSGTTLWTRDTRSHEIFVNGVLATPPAGDLVPSETHGGVHDATGPSMLWLCDRLAERFP